MIEGICVDCCVLLGLMLKNSQRKKKSGKNENLLNSIIFEVEHFFLINLDLW